MNTFNINNYTFNCSLFQSHYPELAKKVSQVCSEFGNSYMPLNLIKLSYAQAVAFSQKRGALYNLLKKLNDKIQLEDRHHVGYFRGLIESLQDYLFKNQSDLAFYNRLKFIVSKWTGLNKKTGLNILMYTEHIGVDHRGKHR